MHSSQWAVPCQLHTLNYYAKLAKTLRTPYGIRVSRAAAGSSDRFAVVVHAQIELWPIAKVSSVLSPKYANCDVLRACEKWQLFRERAQQTFMTMNFAQGEGELSTGERAGCQRTWPISYNAASWYHNIWQLTLEAHTHTHIQTHSRMYTELEPREYRRPLSRHHSDGRTQRGCS